MPASMSSPPGRKQSATPPCHRKRLEQRRADRAAREGYRLVLPGPRHCTDNAAMIAVAAFHRSHEAPSALLDLNAEPSLAL